MITGSLIFSVVMLVIALWVILTITRLRHKLLAIILIGLVLFGYFSFNLALGEKPVDFTTAKGVGQAFGIYFSWLNSALDTTGIITSKAISNGSNANSNTK